MCHVKCKSDPLTIERINGRRAAKDGVYTMYYSYAITEWIRCVRRDWVVTVGDKSKSEL